MTPCKDLQAGLCAELFDCLCSVTSNNLSPEYSRSGSFASGSCNFLELLLCGRSTGVPFLFHADRLSASAGLYLAVSSSTTSSVLHRCHCLHAKGDSSRTARDLTVFVIQRDGVVRSAVLHHSSGRRRLGYEDSRYGANLSRRVADLITWLASLEPRIRRVAGRQKHQRSVMIAAC